ncbi:MAG: signal recognition particle protein [Paracoccaceae bacterium]|jgi:signal recognition particle subunit SRP54
MFENLSERLGGVFDRLTKQGALSEADVATALREVRVALLEADVSLAVARDFVKAVEAKATGQSVTKSVTPGQQVVKIVHDELVRVLAGDSEPEALKIDNPPSPILMVGLQGSGKTTTTAKLAKRLSEKNGKRVLMASLDTNRPAAMEQLQILGSQIGVDTLPIVKGESAVQIAKRAKQQATLGGYDVYMLDTAGRLHIDEVLMDEVQAVRDAVNPRETLLVVDGLTGQDAVNVATEFDGKVGITGVVLTRMDGDGRGGAALSMRAVTGKPIRFVGLGEKMDAIETFEAERVAGRILGMGDIVALVEKAQETIELAEAERMMKRFQKGLFNMNDLKSQLEQMLKMGGMQGLMGMMPGMGKMAKQAEDAGFDDKMLRRQIALVNSMTKKERANPDLLAASRKRRIAAGAGLDVAELNKLLKMHRQMADVMKKMGKMGKGGMLKQAMKQMMGKGGDMPADFANMDPAKMEEAAKAMKMGMGGKGLPGGLGGLGGLGGMGGLGGLKLPGGLSGLGGFGKKK